jgi:N utilization substance protein A
MSAELLQAIDEITREKGINREVIIAAIQESLAAAAKKQYNLEGDVAGEFNKERGGIDIYLVRKVVETVENAESEMELAEAQEFDPLVEIGDILRLPVGTDDMGRRAAQLAKQVIFQKLRDAEKEKIYESYKDKVGTVVSGVVKRFERGDLILDLGHTEARLPRTEQIRGERYAMQDRVRALVIEVHRTARTPQIVVSRTDPQFLVKLFEMEVPEVYDGTVVVRIVAREPGERAKIGVVSTVRDVDPVGACVGIRGSRIQGITRELKGERIDVIPYIDDLTEFAKRALSPARINRVGVLDREKKILEAVVDEDQLSLAIGRRGANVRLAAKLVGWDVQVHTEQEIRASAETQMDKILHENDAPAQAAVASIAEGYDLYDLPGVGVKLIAALQAANLTDLVALGAMSEADLTAVEGIGDKAGKILKAAHKLLAEAAETAAQAAAEAPAAEAETPAADAEAPAAEAETAAAETAAPAAEADAPAKPKRAKKAKTTAIEAEKTPDTGDSSS